MCKKFFVILSVLILVTCSVSAFADKSNGEMYTFCPYMSTLFYNSTLKNFLNLTDTQAAVLQVSLDGQSDGTYMYSDVLKNTIFIFGGANSEFGTGTTAYIYCSLADSSTLKNIPMIIWASIVDMQYNGELKQTGSSFLEWVNGDRSDGDTYSSPYFFATYTQTPKECCSLLLIKY